MIISSALDYREAARRKVPRFLFDYGDGGAQSEQTLRANCSDLQEINLRQRVLKNVADLSTDTALFGEKLSLPFLLGPIGLGGMYARRGEIQTALAAAKKGISFCLSTVSLCSLEEVAAKSPKPLWFQLYVLKDRGFMKNMLERAQSAGVKNLVFTVDMPVPGARYRDRHSGMSGAFAPAKRMAQAIMKPSWAFDVGLLGRPHDLGNISIYRGKKTNIEDYMGWLAKNFDPSISWSDLEWIRAFWKGPMIIKGILDPVDAHDAVSFGADGLVVSNHGGRQLDGALSTAKALPAIVDAVGNNLTVLADGGVRSGLDVVRMLALGAKSVLLGRAYIYALATNGQAGVENLIDIFAKEIRTAMALCGVKSISEITQEILVHKK
ncbi:MAG: FMN-dependent L-lactate dehydrogenase LldD [Alphaproteobacteria bacterium]|nr:FMN-dependent L-lactate dehydrogenase LldD [Alphaproteobacteria bacterium]